MHDEATHSSPFYTVYELHDLLRPDCTGVTRRAKKVYVMRRVNPGVTVNGTNVRLGCHWFGGEPRFVWEHVQRFMERSAAAKEGKGFRGTSKHPVRAKPLPAGTHRPAAIAIDGYPADSFGQRQTGDESSGSRARRSSIGVTSSVCG